MSMAPPSMPIPGEYFHTAWGLHKIYNIITTKNMTKNLNLLILAVTLLITACDKQDATAVKMAGLQDDYQSLGKMKYVYHFVKLSRMTEMELQETRQRYYKDLSNWK